MAKKIHHTTFIIILLLILWPALSLEAGANNNHGKISIHLKERLKVSGEMILFGDIAHIEGTNTSQIEQLKQTPIGKAPRPGYTKTIMPQNILYQLKNGCN